MLHVDYNKVYVCSAVKIFKNKPSKNFKWARCTGSGSSFALIFLFASQVSDSLTLIYLILGWQDGILQTHYYHL